jgi:hypothetical protein
VAEGEPPRTPTTSVHPTSKGTPGCTVRAATDLKEPLVTGTERRGDGPGRGTGHELSRRERFSLRSQISAELDTAAWDWSRATILLSEFGLHLDPDNWHGPSVIDQVATLTDAALLEMYSIVMDVELDEVEGAVDVAADEGNWKLGYVRLFLSHSAWIHRL